VLVAGDHLLAGITPAVGLYPESRPDPLADNLASLRRTVELAPRVVLPGHGEPILDAESRAAELLAHHAQRLEETEAALSPAPQTGYEVLLALFGADLAPTQRRFAVAETLSHLEHLVAQARAARHEDGRSVSYTEP
jgi:glyoxylase-like metal-dependent hydrolase (beta-lactamase superfamily II)